MKHLIKRLLQMIRGKPYDGLPINATEYWEIIKKKKACGKQAFDKIYIKKNIKNKGNAKI
ncbi:MAG: hypothetical protein LC100_11260 [Chitinophagales bacterium]|nr:hypothetical protein [Chitinophagales bacterium]